MANGNYKRCVEMENNQLVTYILANADETSLQQPDLLAQLANYINELIVNDFDELIYVLYRVDVSEKKLTTLLKENSTTNAADMIAALIIERQLQKIKSRREHRRDENIIDEDERW